METAHGGKFLIAEIRVTLEAHRRIPAAENFKLALHFADSATLRSAQGSHKTAPLTVNVVAAGKD